MKKTVFLGLFLMIGLVLFAQEKKAQQFPSVDIKTLDGKAFNTKDITNEGKPIIVSLWATWCKPCLAELMAIDDLYEDWVEETGVKLYAISIDDAKTASRVAPFVNGKGWEFTVLLDQNWDLKRALNIVDIPFLCILNGDGEIVWQHTSYAPGSEYEVFEIVKKIANGEPIE
ncbi:MAG TPA: TlpA disulfide reductase family protein [Bacteroidales bacterium]|jgi:thiol-disulfide isomerase/thioredoxin|nr:TlpA disulfide reductase family protein [Bacteroidales bacterium]HNY62101.1 TlpA disulfide reductase family protein [Bacteroidales bacterium]HOH21776.1 TlpA disulfide reductase family protein [Bacteroidales bacterium]HPZ02915.1 TlpA disulfide reductase family protein [Bacteroidales bacterium]HQB74203.1 TlpA disulfide reductase family protein [Bacteroidales bacterium]